MLQLIVGTVDLYSAAVLVALFFSIGIAVTTAIGKYRKNNEISNEFELAKIKLKDDKEIVFAKLANDRDYKFKQLDQNLITSHKDMGNNED